MRPGGARSHLRQGGRRLLPGHPLRRPVSDSIRLRRRGADPARRRCHRPGREDRTLRTRGRAGGATESPMKVPRYRYPAQVGANAEALLAGIGEIILEGRYVLTKEVSEFESAFAGYLGAGHVRGVDCGTDALAIALRAIGAGPGDEVITQANTFHATVAAILLAGATPVLVDAEE